MIDKKDEVKNVIETLEVKDHLQISGYMTVWSNKNGITKFSGQDKGAVNRSRQKGYKKYIAILVEVDK